MNEKKVPSDSVEGKVEEVVRARLLDTIGEAKEVAPDVEQGAFIPALEKSYQDERYFVIAGSSPLRENLQGEWYA